MIIQLCGLYNYPIMAKKTYSFMKKTGVEWNAVTYGAYNKVRLLLMFERASLIGSFILLGSLWRHLGTTWSMDNTSHSGFTRFRRLKMLTVTESNNEAVRQSGSSFDDDDSDGAMSVDSSSAFFPSNYMQSAANQYVHRSVDATDNVKGTDCWIESRHTAQCHNFFR